MSAPVLKPCPFCGSQPVFLTGISSTVRCTNDQCISNPEPFNDFTHRTDAIEAWNRRAPADHAAAVQAAVQAEREDCARYLDKRKAAYETRADVAIAQRDDDAIDIATVCAAMFEAAAAAIRARGPTDALARMIAEAEARGMEHAAMIAREHAVYVANTRDSKATCENLARRFDEATIRALAGKDPGHD